MFSNFMNAGHDMTKAQENGAISGTVGGNLMLDTWYKSGYYCYYDGGNRGDCRHALDSQAYEMWHMGYSEAEKEDNE